MELVRWANKEGYTIVVTEVERQELIQLLKENVNQITMEDDIYELEVLRESDA